MTLWVWEYFILGRDSAFAMTPHSGRNIAAQAGHRGRMRLTNLEATNRANKDPGSDMNLCETTGFYTSWFSYLHLWAMTPFSRYLPWIHTYDCSVWLDVEEKWKEKLSERERWHAEVKSSRRKEAEGRNRARRKTCGKKYKEERVGARSSEREKEREPSCRSPGGILLSQNALL